MLGHSGGTYVCMYCMPTVVVEAADMSNFMDAAQLLVIGGLTTGKVKVRHKGELRIALQLEW